MIEPVHYLFAWIIIAGVAWVGGMFLYFTVAPLMMFFLGTPKPSDGRGSVTIRYNPNDYDEDGY